MKADVSEEVRQFLAAIGSIRTERKRAASIKNGSATRFRTKPLKEIACTCGAGLDLSETAHPTTCPRGRAIRYRIRRGLKVE